MEPPLLIEKTLDIILQHPEHVPNETISDNLIAVSEKLKRQIQGRLFSQRLYNRNCRLRISYSQIGKPYF